MIQRSSLGLAILVLSMLIPTLRAQDSSTLADRLREADTGSSLDVPDMRPWHLKMTVQLFNAKGKPTEQGTVEEWWGGLDTSRREFKIAPYTATEITSNGKQYRSKGIGSPPFYVSLLLKQVVHPLPPTAEITASYPTLQKRPSGGVTLDCIALTQLVRTSGPGAAVAGYFPTFCLDEGKTHLRMSVVYGDQVIARTSVGQFEGRSVPVGIDVYSKNVPVATAHIDLLAAIETSGSDFALSSDIVEARTKRVRVDEMEMQRPTTTVPPKYPVDAKAKGVAGTVVLGLIIGIDGHVQEVKPISSPDLSLTNAAMEAVHHWIYRPYIVHNEPLEVETTLNVEFTTGR